MSDIVPVFVHGWGFNKDFWRPLINCLEWEDAYCIDLGYFNETAHPLEELHWVCEQKKTILAIGHSLGFLWLLKHLPNRPNIFLIAMNGFSVFASHPQFKAGIPKRILQRMEQQFIRKPKETLNHFYQQCGISSRFMMPHYHVKNLSAGLQLLSQFDGQKELQSRKNLCRVIAGSFDSIVSPEHSHACFDSLTSIQWCDGGHFLPLYQLNQCAQFLQEEKRKLSKHVCC